MSEREDIKNENEREPYEAPAVVSEESFETVSLTCTKTAPTPSCRPPAGVDKIS